MAYGKGSVNKVILLGRLGADVDLNHTASGVAVANFSMATNLVWKDKNNNDEEKSVTEWHRCVAWQKTAEVASKYLKKGSQTYIEGRLQTRKWTDNNSVDRWTTEIVVERLELLGSKGSGSRGVPIPENEFPEPGNNSDEPPVNNVPVPSEDDLPF